jgi:hypothetical protein
MKKGFVKICIDEYDALIIDKQNKLHQLMRQENKLMELGDKFNELENKLNETENARNALARVSKFTVDFLESGNPKLVKEWRDYIKLREETEDAQ